MRCTHRKAYRGYEKNTPAGKKTGNSRNSSYQKRIKGEFSNLDIAVPRDRDSSFDSAILPKGQSRFTGLNDKIITLYARGMTTRDIQAHQGGDLRRRALANPGFSGHQGCLTRR